MRITNGEPPIRGDLLEIVDIQAPKAHRLEISTNRDFPDHLGATARRHPDITIRIGIEGLAETNDSVRGIRNGFEWAMRSSHALRDVGVDDLGFAVTIQVDNAHDLLNLYEFVSAEGAEFAQAVPQNSYCHTDGNEIHGVEAVQVAIHCFIGVFLRSLRPREWSRAYPNRSLVDHVGGAGGASRAWLRRTLSSSLGSARGGYAELGTSVYASRTTPSLAKSARRNGQRRCAPNRSNSASTVAVHKGGAY